jgi:hypothetical protein
LDHQPILRVFEHEMSLKMTPVTSSSWAPANWALHQLDVGGGNSHHKIMTLDSPSKLGFQGIPWKALAFHEPDVNEHVYILQPFPFDTPVIQTAYFVWIDVWDHPHPSYACMLGLKCDLSTTVLNKSKIWSSMCWYSIPSFGIAPPDNPNYLELTPVDKKQ